MTYNNMHKIILNIIYYSFNIDNEINITYYHLYLIILLLFISELITVQITTYYVIVII